MIDQAQIQRITQEVLSRLSGVSRLTPSESPASLSLLEKTLLTEGDVVSAVEQGYNEILLNKGTLITPLAQDALREHGIRVRIDIPSTSPPDPSPLVSAIALGADHGGYDLKETIKKALQDEGRPIKDFGTYSPEPVDYPDIALQVAEAVARGMCSTGIMVDGAGFASAMVANKVPGILAATCWDLFTTRLARAHVGANVLTLGGKVIGPALAIEMVKTWLTTPFEGGRHQRRVQKITDIEKRYLRS